MTSEQEARLRAAKERDQFCDGCTVDHADLSALLAEVERLRAGLRRIRIYAKSHPKNQAVEQIDEFARHALAQEGHGDG